MRRSSLFVAFSLLFVACAGTSGEVITSGTLPRLADAAEVVTARAAIIRFLEAYERVPDDGGTSLAALAGSPAVEHWAAWLAVQFAQVEGRVQGAHVLESMSGMRMLRSDGGAAAMVIEIAAAVSFRITPNEGEPQDQTRSLSGVIVLAYDVSEGWRVVDFTRDGVLLSNTVHVFPPGTGIQERGVTIAVDSFILDDEQWAIGVLVRNDTRRTIGIEPDFVGVYDLVAAPVDPGITPESLQAIAPGRDVRALIAYPIPQDEEISGLRLVVGARIPGDERPVFLDVPVRPVLRNLERAGAGAPSPSPTGSV